MKKVQDKYQWRSHTNCIQYFKNDRLYIAVKTAIAISIYKNSDFYSRFMCGRCEYCKLCHHFEFRKREGDVVYYFSSYCGMRFRLYKSDREYQIHRKRRKVIRAIIKYAKKMKEIDFE